MATHSGILAWEIPWTEEPGGYSPWGHKESDTTERLHFHKPSRLFLLFKSLYNLIYISYVIICVCSCFLSTCSFNLLMFKRRE